MQELDKGDKENAAELLKNNYAQVEDLSCAKTRSGEVVSMCVDPIKIRYQNARKELNTYALLDSCSQETFKRKGIVQTIGASEYETQTTVMSLNENQFETSFAVENSKIASNGSKHWSKLRKNYPGENLSVDRQEVVPTKD